MGLNMITKCLSQCFFSLCCNGVCNVRQVLCKTSCHVFVFGADMCLWVIKMLNSLHQGQAGVLFAESFTWIGHTHSLDQCSTFLLEHNQQIYIEGHCQSLFCLTVCAHTIVITWINSSVLSIIAFQFVTGLSKNTTSASEFGQVEDFFFY